MRDIWSTLPDPPEAGPSKSRTYTPPENEEPHPFVDLTLAGFREDNGRLFIPPTVRHAEKTLRASKDMISDGMTERGWEPFLDSAVRFAYGSETPPYRKGLVSLWCTFACWSACRKLTSLRRSAACRHSRWEGLCASQLRSSHVSRHQSTAYLASYTYQIRHPQQTHRQSASPGWMCGRTDSWMRRKALSTGRA